MRKKVLITLNNSKLSGIERFVLLLAEHIDKDKFDLVLALPTVGPFCELLKTKKIAYFVFDNKKNGNYTLSGIIFLLKHIFKTKYDIIHAQAGIVPCILGKVFGVGLIIEHKHGLDFTYEQIQSFSFLSTFYQKLKKFFCDYTITVCDNDKNVLINKFKYKADKVITVYNGIEPVARNPKPLNRITKIGTVGRLTYQKAQEYFIHMAEKIYSAGLECEFLIYGDGEDYNKLKTLIEERGLTNYVKLMGYTDDVNSVLKNLDIFVLTSRYEGIPYILLEAMNNSLPVISTDVGGIKEIIKNDYNGILVKQGDVNALVENVKVLIRNDNYRTELSNNAKSYFQEKFTVDKTVQKVESIYKSGFKNLT